MQSPPLSLIQVRVEEGAGHGGKGGETVTTISHSSSSLPSPPLSLSPPHSTCTVLHQSHDSGSGPKSIRKDQETKNKEMVRLISSSTFLLSLFIFSACMFTPRGWMVWFSRSPLPRLHHHDIMHIVELFFILTIMELFFILTIVELLHRATTKSFSHTFTQTKKRREKSHSLALALTLSLSYYMYS